MPLRGKETSQLLGLHGTTEAGLRGILADGYIRGTAHRPYGDSWLAFYCKGFIYNDVLEGFEHYDNKWRLSQIMSSFRSFTKHQRGVVCEVRVNGTHVAISNAHKEEQVRPGTYTHYTRDGRWCVDQNDAVLTALWVDMQWKW